MDLKVKQQLSELKKTLKYLQLWNVGKSQQYKYFLCKILVCLNYKLCQIRYFQLRKALRDPEIKSNCRNDVIQFINIDSSDLSNFEEDYVFIYSKGCWRLLKLEFVNWTESKVAFLSQQLHFNLFGGTNNTRKWFFYRPIFTYRIEKATTVNVSLIKTRLSTSLLAKYTDEALRNYFRKPVLLAKNDCFRIDIDEFCTYVNNCQWNTNEFVEKQLYFRVTSVLDASGNETNIGCYCDSKSSKLIQDCNSQSFVFYDAKCVPKFFLDIHNQIHKGLQCFLSCANFDMSIEYLKPIFLLSGEKGSGKRFLISNLAKQLGFHCYQFECSYFQSMNLDQIHGELKSLFVNLRVSTPCILLMNDFELFAKNTDNNIEYRLIDVLEKEIEKIFKRNYLNFPLIIFCLVADKKSLVTELNRIFLESFSMPHLGSAGRRNALRWIVNERQLELETADVIDEIADKAYGFNLSDLFNLISKSKTTANCLLTNENLNGALDEIQKTYNESIGAPKVPKVNWDDIGGLENIKEEILRTINLPIQFKSFFKKGSFKRSGILLHGPPGTGKTLIAKAVATENNFCFLSVKGPELLNMYVGQSEKNIREIFTKARQASPCIIFFDELDSLIPKRGNLGDSSGVMDRLSSQMLTEMDQLNDEKFIFVIGATNRLDLIDTAFLRPGRFDKVLYVGVCSDTESKVKILTALLKRFKMDLNVRDLLSIADQCPKKVSGADLYSICSNAWMSAIRRIIHNQDLTDNIVVTVNDFKDALFAFNNK